MSGCIGSTGHFTDDCMVMINEIVAAMRIYRQFSKLRLHPRAKQGFRLPTPVATQQVRQACMRHAIRFDSLWT